MLVLFALLILAAVPLSLEVWRTGRLARSSHIQRAVRVHRHAVNLLTADIAAAAIVIGLFEQVHLDTSIALTPTVHYFHRTVIYTWIPVFLAARFWYTGEWNPRVHHWLVYSSFGLLFIATITGGIMFYELAMLYGLF